MPDPLTDEQRRRIDQLREASAGSSGWDGGWAKDVKDLIAIIDDLRVASIEKAEAVARHPSNQVQPLGGSISISSSSPWGTAR